MDFLLVVCWLRFFLVRSNGSVEESGGSLYFSGATLTPNVMVYVHEKYVFARLVAKEVALAVSCFLNKP